MYIYQFIHFIVIYNKLKITIHYHTYAFRSILEKNVTIKIKTIAPNNAGRTKMPPIQDPNDQITHYLPKIQLNQQLHYQLYLKESLSRNHSS